MNEDTKLMISAAIVATVTVYAVGGLVTATKGIIKENRRKRAAMKAD